MTVAPARAYTEAVLNSIKVCPKGVFGVDDGKLVVENPVECTLCKSCMESVNYDGSVTIEGDENNLLFTFETDGSLTAEQTLNKAAEILSEKAKALYEEFGQMK